MLPGWKIVKWEIGKQPWHLETGPALTTESGSPIRYKQSHRTPTSDCLWICDKTKTRSSVTNKTPNIDLSAKMKTCYFFTNYSFTCTLLLLLLSRFSRVQLCETHRRQPTSLSRPWDSPDKNNGVGCHFLLQCMKVKSESEVAQLCPTQQPHGLQPTRLLRTLVTPRYPIINLPHFLTPFLQAI